MSEETTNRTLICLRYGIGDVVMEMPALRGLRRLHPNRHFTALGAWPALELLEGDPRFDSIMGIQHFGFAHWGDIGTVNARDALEQWLRDNHFNAVLDACHTAVGIRQVLQKLALPTFNTGGRIEAHSNNISHGAHAIWASAVRAWDLPTHFRYSEPRLFISAQATRRARTYFRQHELTDHRAVVGLAPIASSHLKRWPMEKICELVRQLTALRDLHILVFGVSGTETSTISQLERFSRPGSLHWVEPVHLQETAALIARCHALLANDTGLMHIGAAVGTPALAIFGPTSPHVVLPRLARAVSSPISCEYRLTETFGPPQCVLMDRCLVATESCINAVTVAPVLKALIDLLDRPPVRGGCQPEETTP